MWNTINYLFRSYMGSGMIVIWCLVSLIYLLIKEKRKHIRILFVYVPLILLLIFFNPMTARLIYDNIGDEIYYRILWLLPMTVIIAYAAVEIYGALQGKKKAVFAVVTALLIGISGSYVYDSPYFQKAENIYHMPQSVVDICDAIEVEGREVMAVFPAELLQYVRQYSPVVCMPYGREITVERWNRTTENPFYDAMEAEQIDAALVAGLAKQEECAYIILPQKKEILGEFEDYDFVVFGQVEGYTIYKDSTVNLEIL